MAMLTLGEAARLVGVSKSTLARAIKAGRMSAAARGTPTLLSTLLRRLDAVTLGGYLTNPSLAIDRSARGCWRYGA